MPGRLVLASMLTLGFLVGSLVLVVFAGLAFGGAPTSTLVVVAVLGVLFTFLVWAIGPWFTDLIQSWFYNVERLDFEDFARRYPAVGASMREVCAREGLPLPAMRLVKDDNPTAYTYGSLPGNARVALSEGLFRFLDDDEVSAVAAHELGHIRHYDFLVMTVAAVLLQLLYEGYFWLKRQAGDNDRRYLIGVAMVAYLLWWLGTYAVLWLSRTREYMADRFAATSVGDAAPLQRALVKVAYGLAELQAVAERSGTTANTRLLQSTRALGLSDPKVAVSAGVALHVRTEGSAALAPEYRPDARAFVASLVEPVMRFDLFSPWATVLELGSTHPLTGKRLKHLDEIQAELHRPPTFRWEAVDASGAALDRDRLYGDFAFELVIFLLPRVLPFVGLGIGLLRPELAPGLAVSFLGIGLLVRGLYTYGWMGEFEPATVYERLCDPYASPLRGQPVLVEGTIIGKADAGSRVGEDVMMKDRSGALVALNFEALIPIIGNWIFGSNGAAKAVGRHAVAEGWFRRGLAHSIDLQSLRVGTLVYPSYTRFWGLAGGGVVLFVGVLFVVAGLGIGAPGDLLGAQDDGPVEPVRNEQGLEVW